MNKDEEENLHHNAENSILKESISVCSNGEINYTGELISESGALPADFQDVVIHVHFFKKKVEFAVGDYSAKFSIDSEVSYIPFVETAFAQTI